MQHQILTTKRFPSDLKDYHQPAPDQGLISVAKSVVRGISSISQVFCSITKGTSYSFINLIPGKKPSLTLPSKRQSRGKSPSKATLKLIAQINKGFDPLSLSRQRWLVELEEQEKEQIQKKQEVIQKYQAHMNKENQREKGKTKDIKTIRVQQSEESSIYNHLWFIAEEDLNLCRKRVDAWKNQEKGGSTPQKDTSFSAQGQQLPIEQSVSPSQQDFSSKQIANHPTKLNHQSSLKEQNPRAVQANSQKFLQLAQNPQKAAQSKQLKPSSSNQETQVQSKAKQNPFLSTTVPKKVSLIDMILSNSSNLFKESNDSEPSRPETNQKHLTPAFGNPTALFNQPQPQINANTPSINLSKPNFSDIFGISSIKKEATTAKPELLKPISLFGPGFNSSNTQQSNLQSQSNGKSQQAGIFPRAVERPPENMKHIMDMFGARASGESSLFNDAKSQRTQKKSMQAHPSRRHNKKTNTLRVS